MIAHRDPLSELAKFVAIESVSKLRLADEDDLQQLVLISFEVGQQPDLLEQLVRHVLRFIEEEDDHHSGVGAIEQELVEPLDQSNPVVAASRRGGARAGLTA